MEMTERIEQEHIIWALDALRQCECEIIEYKIDPENVLRFLITYKIPA